MEKLDPVLVLLLLGALAGMVATVATCLWLDGLLGPDEELRRFWDDQNK